MQIINNNIITEKEIIGIIMHPDHIELQTKDDLIFKIFYDELEQVVHAERKIIGIMPMNKNKEK